MCTVQLRNKLRKQKAWTYGIEITDASPLVSLNPCAVWKITLKVRRAQRASNYTADSDECFQIIQVEMSALNDWHIASSYSVFLELHVLGLMILLLITVFLSRQPIRITYKEWSRKHLHVFHDIPWHTVINLQQYKTSNFRFVRHCGPK